MRIPSKGEIVRTDTAHKGEIVILPSDSVGLNDVLGDNTRLPRERWCDAPLPMLRMTITPKTAAQRERLLDALTQIADTDPLLHYEVDSTTPVSYTHLHAVRFYELRSTPAAKAGNMGSEERKEMLFWTKAEYQKFADAMMDKPVSYYAFEMLLSLIHI